MYSSKRTGKGAPVDDSCADVEEAHGEEDTDHVLLQIGREDCLKCTPQRARDVGDLVL